MSDACSQRSADLESASQVRAKEGKPKDEAQYQAKQTEEEAALRVSEPPEEPGREEGHREAATSA